MTLVHPLTKGGAYQALLDRDDQPIPEVLRLNSPLPEGHTTVAVDRYTSADFHRLEVEYLWKRVWQMACREEEIPEVGDHMPYEIAGIQLLVVRTAPDRIRAYRNVCRHRGRLLKEYPGRSEELRCAFHGVAWNLDGTLKHLPCRWDFAHVDDADWTLPEVRVGTWGGFVFVNLDNDAAPLEEHLGELPDHFTRWPLEDRYIQAHVGKVVRANWKLTQEAFMESYHVVATHPQLLVSLSDTGTQYDAFGNFARQISANGLPSGHLKWEPTEQDIIDAMLDRNLDEDPTVVIPEGATARRTSADLRRQSLAQTIGDKAHELCDSEVSDSFVYYLFPNFHPWGAYNRIVYRFRPWQNRPDRSLMECYYLSPFKGERPKPAPMHLLTEDDDWTDAPELGLLARVFNQDEFNMAKVQAGLESGAMDVVTFADYQETKMRHFHGLLDHWLTR